VFGGCKDVNPGIVKVPVNLKGDYAQAMLANSITLTPGTITMDIAEQGGQTYYYIHWIDVAETDREKAGKLIKGSLEKGIGRIWQ
jgi:multicomponent Na+:H+ antiporter subunit E